MNCTLLNYVEDAGHYVPMGTLVRVLGWRATENGGWVRCLAGAALRKSDGVVVRDVEVEVLPAALRFNEVEEDEVEEDYPF